MVTMRYKFYILYLIGIYVQLAQCIPVPQLPQIVEYPRAYNLFTEISPNDVNDLEPTHMKRAMVDVTQTISEVQKLLETDPNLPRLTRGEIEDLFENVTRDEMENSLRIGDNDRAKHMRALMLVLPYNTNNYSDGNFEEMYTKPPITKFIDNETTEKIQTTKSEDTINNNIINNKNIKAFSNIYEIEQINAELNQIEPQNNAKITTYHPTNEYSNYISTYKKSPEKYSSHYNSDKMNNINVIPSKKFSNEPLHSETVKDMLAGIGLAEELTSPSSLSSTTTTTTTSPTTKPTTTNDEIQPSHLSTTLKPEITPELLELLQSFGLLTNERLPNVQMKDDHLPEHIEEEFQPIMNPNVIKNNAKLNTEIAFKPLPPALKAHSLRMISSPELTPTDYYRFKPLPIPNDVTPHKEINSDLESILETYGLIDNSRSSRQSRKQKSLKNIEDKILDTEFDEPLIDDMQAEESMIITTTELPISSKIPHMDAVPEVEVDFLSSDLMDVLEHIGIATPPQHQEQPQKQPRQLQQQENTKTNATIKSNEKDLEQYHHLLDNIKELDKLTAHLSDKEINELNLKHYTTVKSIDANHNIYEKLHPVYRPEYSMSKNGIKRQISDGNALNTTESPDPLRFTLDLKVRTNDNDNINNSNNNDDDVSTSIEEPFSTELPTTKQFITSTIELQSNIKSVDEEEIDSAQINGDDNENDDQTKTTINSDIQVDDNSLLLQNLETSSTTTTTETTSSTTTESTSTEEARNGSVADLEDSFASSDDGGLDPVTEQPLPQPRRNGFYFLADWNSFLEVGEDPNKVVVRFDPKIGDPSRFIPVTIP